MLRRHDNLPLIYRRYDGSADGLSRHGPDGASTLPNAPDDVACRGSEGFRHGAHLDFNDPRTRGLFAGQQHCAGYVFGLEHAGVADPFLGATPAKRKFGLYATGTDHADFDAVRPQLPVKGLRETYLSKLGCTIHRFARKTVDARHRRDHQDGALLLPEHDRNRVPREQKRGAHICIHEVIVFLRARVHEVLVIADARIIDQDVDLPERVQCGFNRAFGGIFLSGIAEDADRLRAKLFCLLLELVKPLLAPCREHESRALLRQGTRASLSDTGACTGNQSHFSTEIRSHIFVFLYFVFVGFALLNFLGDVPARAPPGSDEEGVVVRKVMIPPS
jgi:hypothetical protein